MSAFVRIVSVAAAFLGAGCLLLSSHGDNWPCNVDVDCQKGEWCGSSFGNRICLPRTTCDEGGRCPGKLACVAKKCIQAECLSSSDCAPYTCDMSTYKCRNPCSTSGDCAYNASCVDGACVVGQCVGTAMPCSVHTSSAECGAVSSCQWSTCSGTATACSGLYSYSCKQQTGCSFDSYDYACKGQVTPCSEISDYSCIMQQGCRSGGTAHCIGKVSSCSTRTGYAQCLGQPGCAWE